MSRVDKTATECYYEIDIDLETRLPKSITKLVLTGVRGANSGKKKQRRIGHEEHVAFHFTYTLDSFGQVDRFAIPRDAQKLLR